MPAYEAICSDCRAPFKAPFQPSPGRNILCAECLILQQNLSQHPFFIGLEAFARDKFGQNVQAFKVVKSKGNYDVLVQLKDAKAPFVAKVEFSSATGHDIPGTLPAPMIANIVTGDAEFKVLLAEFMKKGRYKDLTLNLQ